MASLLEHLSERPEHDRLIFFGGKWHSCCDLVDLAISLRQRHPNSAGANVIFRAGNQFEAVSCALALDGFAANILISSDSSNLVAEEIFKEQLGEYVLFEADSPPCEISKSTPKRTDTVWTIPTSGTTGTPKLVQHSLESLTRSVRKDSVKGSTLVWGQLYEISRFAGLQVLFQALLGGSAIVLTDDLGSPTSLGATFTEAGVNALSGTPTMWRRLLMSGALDSLSLRIITLGGEATDDFLLNELSTKFPESKISHIYASTEAGVGFSVSDRKAGFPSDYLNGELPNGVRIRVNNDGRLFLKRQGDHTSYLGIGAAAGEDGWIDSGDLVEKKGDRFLFIGRANGTINVGGMKVQPLEIEQTIQSHPGVAMVAVSARKNPFMGNLVQATVVPKAAFETTELQKELTALCKERLAEYKVPAVWKFSDELPVTSSGKISRA